MKISRASQQRLGVAVLAGLTTLSLSEDLHNPKSYIQAAIAGAAVYFRVKDAPRVPRSPRKPKSGGTA